MMTDNQSRSFCMICAQDIPVPPSHKIKGYIKFKNIFQVFMDYMKIKAPATFYKNNLFKEQIPFCQTCVHQVIQLYEYHEQRQSLSESISKLVCNFTAKIIENPVPVDTEKSQSLRDVGEFSLELESKHLIPNDEVFENDLPVALRPTSLLLNEIVGLRKEIVKRYSADVVVKKEKNLPLLTAATPGSSKGEHVHKDHLDTGDAGSSYYGEDLDRDYPSDVSCQSDDDEHSNLSCLTDEDDDILSSDYEENEDDVDYDPKKKPAKKVVPKPKKEVDSDAPPVKIARGPYKKKKKPESSETENKKKSRLARRIGPNQFAMNEFTFEKIGDEYKCGSCVYSHRSRQRIHYHVKHVHAYAKSSKNRLMEIAPDQFLYANKFPAAKVFNVYKCGTCEFMSERKDSLHKHLQKHLDPNPLKTLICEACGKAYAKASSLRAHIKSHSEERRFQCEICAKTYKVACALKIHMEIHTGEDTKRFICEVCGFKARHSKKLNMHMAKHTRAKIYECPHCDKKYAWEVALEYHLKSHDPDHVPRMYDCDFCDMKFKAKSSIPRHIRVVHNGEKSSEVFRRSTKPKPENDVDIDVPAPPAQDRDNILGGELGFLFNMVPHHSNFSL